MAESAVTPPGGSSERRIHNFDQRSLYVVLEHEALAKPLRLEQRGATSAGFEPGTSSVAWPVAERMAKHLLARPELVRGRCGLELGAGLGLLGAASAALGTKCMFLTDWQGAIPLLERNQALLAEDGLSVEVARLSWGDEDDFKALLQRWPDRFDLLLASDVIVAGFDTKKLLASCLALLVRSPTARLLIGFEFREDWETIGNFIHGAEEAGLHCSHELLNDGEDVEDDEGHDGDMYLYTFRWQEFVS